MEALGRLKSLSVDDSSVESPHHPPGAVDRSRKKVSLIKATETLWIVTKKKKKKAHLDPFANFAS